MKTLFMTFFFSIAVLAMGMIFLGSSIEEAVNIPAPTKEWAPNPEADSYWEEANAKEAVRQEAIKRDANVVEWRGDWNPDTKLALFHGEAHQSDVRAGGEMLDLVEVDQITLREYKDGQWVVVAAVQNNLQPGGKVVFIR